MGESVVTHWRALAERSLEHNGFFDPGFLLSAARNLDRSASAQLLLVWADNGARMERVLVGLWPIVMPSFKSVGAFATIWCDKQWTFGVPLLDRDCATEAVITILRWLRTERPEIVGLKIPFATLEGSFFDCVEAASIVLGLHVRTLGEHSRAILRHGVDGHTYTQTKISAGRRKRLKSLRRGLERQGVVSFQLIKEPRAAILALDDFLRIEAQGWKGRRKTALACDSKRDAFTRHMAAQLAAHGDFWIARLDVGERRIAAGIVIKAHRRVFFWKICYDERYSRSSPGELLSYELTRELLSDDAIELSDSCAVADHPMINHLWHSRMSVGDVFISTDPRKDRIFTLGFGSSWMSWQARRAAKRSLTIAGAWLKRVVPWRSLVVGSTRGAR